jgi:hypothetical protein
MVGVVSAFSTLHPLFRRIAMVSSRRPISSAHCLRFWVRPFNVSGRLLRRLFCCSFCVAQTQLEAEYGPLVSLRSSVCLAEGLGPMSARNCTKLSQAGSTTIPRPPYNAKSEWCGLRHLLRILPHVLYSIDPAKPWNSRGLVSFLRIPLGYRTSAMETS